MLLDAAKHPGLPAHAIQSYLHMPSKPDARITHVLAICRVHVREVQPAAKVLPVISRTKERESYLLVLPPHRGCVTTHLASVPGAESGPQSAADFSCGSASLLWGFLLSFLVFCQCLHWSPSDLPFKARADWEAIALCNCNHVKGLPANPLTYSIIPSLKWFAPPRAGRPELPVHHTHLSGEMRQRKQGQRVSVLLTSCRALKPVIAQIT